MPPTVNGMLTRWRHNSISYNKTQLGAQMPQPKHRSRNMLGEAETSFEDTVFRGFETWKG